ncbi:uncharacterized protein PAC_18623 [Phialocephala subalpina]|uniref:AA1-like domain-containing protein n=1 Tax=Phialocephala subalpina TaxID=576137 RepID=A0A1L7XUL8_9HELO|nr:uncharacterized protein PAC_18623 [Phialocephala subalpina]
MKNTFQSWLGLFALFLSSSGAATNSTSCTPFPLTVAEFSSSFQQPVPPLVQTEYKTSWVQHKWNVNLSHIAARFLSSPTAKKDCLVSNILYEFSPSIASPPTIFSGYVNPGFPLPNEDILVGSNAVFAGFVKRNKNGIVASVSSCLELTRARAKQ